MSEKYKELFEGYRSGTVEVSGYFVKPCELDNAERIAEYDKSAERVISKMQETIERLQSYRVALAERYNTLETMNFSTTVSLERYRRYSGDSKVTYTLEVFRTYEDGTRQTQSRKVYPGSERRQAFTDFQSIQAAHRDYIVIQSTDKMRWEK